MNILIINNILLAISCFLFINSITAWRYDIFTYNKQASQHTEMSPQLHFLEEFKESITKKVVLEDGRIVICKIPLNMEAKRAKTEDEDETKEEIIKGLT